MTKAKETQLNKLVRKLRVFNERYARASAKRDRLAVTQSGKFWPSPDLEKLYAACNRLAGDIMRTERKIINLHLDK